jgi:hypothetical protein
LATGTDSHVNTASATSTFIACIRRASAHILSHASKTIKSQTVKSSESTNSSFHHLITFALSDAISFNDSIDFSALYSCTKPSIAFKITITAMTIASTHSHITIEITIANNKIKIKKLLNCSKNIFQGLILFFVWILFSPYFFLLSSNHFLVNHDFKFVE